jgi:hypothetical protein
MTEINLEASEQCLTWLNAYYFLKQPADAFLYSVLFPLSSCLLFFYLLPPLCLLVEMCTLIGHSQFGLGAVY